MQPTERDSAHFWAKVHKRQERDGCWEWTAHTTTTGYGQFRYQGRLWRAHRAAWLLACGPIPPGPGHHGTVVMHRCDNRRCVRPQHLALGTQADKVADCKAKGRHCKKRHEGQ